MDCNRLKERPLAMIEIEPTALRDDWAALEKQSQLEK